jgi:Methyltransferase TRM13
MDIRHCFVPYLPGILENDTILKNGIIKDGEDDRNKGGISMKAKEGENKKEDVTENEVVMEAEKADVSVKKIVENGVDTEEMEGVQNGILLGVEKEVEKCVVIMAKHLCGVATDLALRSLEAFIIPTSTSTSTLSSDVDQTGQLL